MAPCHAISCFAISKEYISSSRQKFIAPGHTAYVSSMVWHINQESGGLSAIIENVNLSPETFYS